MFQISLLLFFVFTTLAEPTCENGWSPYKDELCIKIFPNDFITYDEAREFCAAFGSSTVKASLVMVKNEDIQIFLNNSTKEAYNSIWLGGRYENATGEFKWEDGNSIVYTNWQEDYPKLVDRLDSCIELRPPNSKSSENSEGNWADVSCHKRNLVVCQKDLTWSLEDAINEIKRIRIHFEEELEDVKSQFNEELEELRSQVIPVGSIYIEYYSQPTPQALWPKLTWQDISSTFAGKFFRVSGGEAAAWGVTQASCAPRITHMRYASTENIPAFESSIAIPVNGWSPYCKSDGNRWSADTEHEAHGAISVQTESCEVRPSNIAVRIWKRTA